MKLLFSIKCDGSFWVEKENEIYSIWKRESGRENDGITLDIYDTKTRSYVAKGIPECCLYLWGYDGEPEVILAAIDLIPKYKEVEVCEIGTIIGKKDGFITVYNFYDNE